MGWGWEVWRWVRAVRAPGCAAGFFPLPLSLTLAGAGDRAVLQCKEPGSDCPSSPNFERSVGLLRLILERAREGRGEETLLQPEFLAPAPEGRGCSCGSDGLVAVRSAPRTRSPGVTMTEAGRRAGAVRSAPRACALTETAGPAPRLSFLQFERGCRQQAESFPGRQGKQ